MEEISKNFLEVETERISVVANAVPPAGDFEEGVQSSDSTRGPASAHYASALGVKLAGSAGLDRTLDS